MAAKKKQTFKRIKEREYDWVEFTFPEVYGHDATFTLPSLARIPMYVAESPMESVGTLMTWLNGAGVPGEMSTAIIDLDPKEFRAFQKLWGKASPVDLPKSVSSSDSTDSTEKE